MLQICHLNGIVSSAEESRENFGASVNIEWFGMDRRGEGEGEIGRGKIDDRVSLRSVWEAKKDRPRFCASV